MSSFKKKNIQKCIYCHSILNQEVLTKCSTCHLYLPTSNLQIKNINLKNIYVINLKSDTRRLGQFNNSLKYSKTPLINRNWNRFDAIDGTDYELVKETAKKITDKDITHLWENHKGSIGCYLSHLKLWKTLQETKQNYSLIMEDDSHFIRNGLNNLELVLLKSLKFEWDILYIGHNIISGRQVHPLFVIPDNSNKRGFNSGFFGYIINHKSINKLLNIFSRFDSPFIDVQARIAFKEFNALFVRGDLIKHFKNISTRKMRDYN